MSESDDKKDAGDDTEPEDASSSSDEELDEASADETSLEDDSGAEESVEESNDDETSTDEDDRDGDEPTDDEHVEESEDDGDGSEDDGEQDDADDTRDVDSEGDEAGEDDESDTSDAEASDTEATDEADGESDSDAATGGSDGGDGYDGDDDGGDGDDGADLPDGAEPGDWDREDIHRNDRPGVAAMFEHPDDLLEAARATRDSDYEEFDVYSPFPIHGMDEAMGLGRSWMPWVTFVAGLVGFLSAVAMEFGMMTFDWPMIIGGKPYASWPAFVPVMFELTVLIGGVTTGVVMLVTAGCFQRAQVIDEDITNDRFALWISGDDPHYDVEEVVEFVQDFEPVAIKTFTDRR